MVLPQLESRFNQVEFRRKWRDQDFKHDFRLDFIAIHQKTTDHALILSISKFPRWDPIDLWSPPKLYQWLSNIVDHRGLHCQLITNPLCILLFEEHYKLNAARFQGRCLKDRAVVLWIPCFDLHTLYLTNHHWCHNHRKY